jgi:diguanylate cyclase (GGDEF)-like protein
MSETLSVSRLRAEQPTRRGLPREAALYLFGVLLLAGTLTATASLHGSVGGRHWSDFAFLAVAGSVAQLFARHTQRNQVFHTGLAFAVAGSLLLPPPLIAALCVLQHLPDWVRHRYPWYIQAFNVGNYVTCGIAASTVARVLAAHGFLSGGSTAASVAAGIAAGCSFVIVNHLLLANMLLFARGRRPGANGLLDRDSLLTDASLAAIGIASAYALRHAPALTPLVVFPVVLIHRALLIPSLRDAALRDHKTGLLNARGVEQEAEREISRSNRFCRPVAIVILDVDGLSAINNEHGHLVGDAALTLVADALRTELRDYDVCGRIGGDEFLAILPETTAEEAEDIAMRVKRALTETPLSTGHWVLRVGASIGTAAASAGGRPLRELIAEADAAMYGTKRSLRGLAPRLTA